MKLSPNEIARSGVVLTGPNSSPRGHGGTSPRAVLREALASGRRGEVVARSGDEVGRIYVIDGGVAWAIASGAPARVEKIVRYAGVTLGDDVVSEVLGECRRTGAHFADVLVAWGLLDTQAARECVRRFVAEHLAILLAWEDAAALFLPIARDYASGLNFTWSEVCGATIPPGALGGAEGAGDRAPSLAWISAAMVLAGEVERVAGVVGVVVLDASSGAIVVSAGEPVEEPIAGGVLSALRNLGAAGGEVIATRGETAFIGRTFFATGALVAQFDLATTNLAMARLALLRLVGSGLREEAQPGEFLGGKEREHG